MMNFNFVFNKELCFGSGRALEIPQFVKKFGSNILLITNRSTAKSPFWERLQSSLENNGISYVVEFVRGEPSVASIDGLAARYRAGGIECVVSIGGGSVIDTGKALSAMLRVSGSVGRYLEGVGNSEHPGTKIPFIAAPTTAGTGSEATKNAVISSVGGNGYKKSLRHNNFIPDIAVLDPELSLTLPEDITVSTGMDTFTQLLGAYTSTKANPLTDALALDGLRAFASGFERVIADPSDVEARGSMLYAAYISGVVLAHAGLDLVHGYASSVGGVYDIPHGVICAVLAYPVIRFNVEYLLKNGDGTALDKYDRVGMIIAGEGCGGGNGALMLVEQVRGWNEKFFPDKLKRYSIKNEDVNFIVKTTDLKNNPVKIDSDGIREILMGVI